MRPKPEETSFFSGSHAIVTPTYKQQAYDLIKEAILYRRLEVGVVYSQDSICTELGISRTPVREALLELQQEGYLTFLRGRGISVQRMTTQEAKEIVEMRFYMERFSSRLAAQRAKPEHLSEMKENIELMRQGNGTTDHRYLYKLDRTFHQIMGEAAGNNWLRETIDKLRDHFLRIETQTAFDDPVMSAEVVREHEAIYQAILAGDQDRAEHTMNLHLERTYERTIRKLLEV